MTKCIFCFYQKRYFFHNKSEKSMQPVSYFTPVFHGLWLLLQKRSELNKLKNVWPSENSCSDYIIRSLGEEPVKIIKEASRDKFQMRF